MLRDRLLIRIRDDLDRRATRDPRTILNGLLISRHETVEPDYQLTEPLFVLMAQGAKRLYLGDEVVQYGPGDCLVVTATIPLSGHFVGAGPQYPALAVALRLEAAEIAKLVPRLPNPTARSRHGERCVNVYAADIELLDAIGRLLRLLDHPDDLPVLAPLIEREILWRLLVGPFGETIAQIGLADSNLAHISRAISWLRDNYATPVAVPQLARMAGMSESAFHRNFRGITGMTPLQFQKHLRLQEARSLLLTHRHDITGVARSVGYGSPTQFTREYRRLFGTPPRRDAANFRTTIRPDAVAGASIEPA